jgi:DNA modification methylase
MSEPWISTQIESWSTESLLPYVRNARTHSPEQISQIAASIVEFGFTNPILAGSDKIIVAGHGRLLAAQKLGLTEVPVVVLDHLTPAQRKALIIADNKIAENAGWDEELLRTELQALIDEGFNLDLTGFDPDELDEIFVAEESTIEGITDEDETPEISELEISRPGDVWILGDHRLVCGDATEASSYDLLLAGDRVQMIWSDLPYNVNYANNAKDKLRGKHRPILNDNLGDGFYQFVYDALSLMVPACDGAIYIAMSSSELDTLQSAFRAAGGKWSTFIIWAKNTFTLGRADYQRQYEPILYGWPEGSSHHWCGDRNQGDVWNIKKPARNDLHPTMKPVELVERSIRNSSRNGDIVLDCFGGSGSTLIAAEKTARRCFMMELDPKYCDVIIRRWQEFTGREAISEDGSRVFNELVNEAEASCCDNLAS